MTWRSGGRQRRRRRYRRHAGQYTAAVEAAEQRGELPVQWRAQAEVLHKLGRLEEARTAAKLAREIVDRLATTVSDERLRATFLQSSAVQRLAAIVGT